MQFRHRPLQTAVALWMLLPALWGQGQESPRKLLPAPSPQSARFDYETGTLTRGPVLRTAPAAGYTTSTTFDNLDLSGFAGTDSGPGVSSGPCLWMDAADKGFGTTGGASGLMTGFSFGYMTSRIDTAIGGPGVEVRVGFRAGYTAGVALNQLTPDGTDVGTFTMTGLPGSFTGGFVSQIINVDLGNSPVVLVDGPIGWSWEFRDVDSGGVYAETGPLLSFVQDPGPDPTGNMVDAMDRFCGSSLSTNSFSYFTGTGQHISSMAIAIREAEALATSNTLFNGSGANPVLLSASAGPALGQVWSLSLDCSGAGATKLALWRLSFLPLGPPVPSPWGEILVAQTGPGKNFFGPHGGGVATLGGFALPLDMSFYGASWHVQGFCGDSPKGYFSNGITQTMGF